MARECVQMMGAFVTNFIVRALQGQDITIYGEELQAGVFCYCDDLIEGFVRLINHEGLSYNYELPASSVRPNKRR
jgi:nucleoside-diphosphate-sugar epimerase